MAFNLELLRNVFPSRRRTVLLDAMAEYYKNGQHEKALQKAKVLLREDFDSGLLESSLNVCNEILI